MELARSRIPIIGSKLANLTAMVAGWMVHSVVTEFNMRIKGNSRSGVVIYLPLMTGGLTGRKATPSYTLSEVLSAEVLITTW